MGWGKFFKKAANVVLPNLGIVGGAANGLIQGGGLKGALKGGLDGGIRAAAMMAGPELGGALGIGSAAGSALAGAGGGALGAGIRGDDPFTGAVSGALGGYMSGGGLNDLFSGTSLSSGINSISNGLGFGDVISPAADAARATTSAAASAAPSSTLSGYLPSSGGGAASGGSGGGFFSRLFGGSTPTVGADQVGKAVTSSNLPWLNDVASGTIQANPIVRSTPWLSDVASGALKSNPFTDYSAVGLTSAQTLPWLSEGASTVASKPLLSNILKIGVPYALQNNNTGGYNALRGAAQNTAQMYQPYVDNGTAATQKLSALYGLNGTDAQSQAMADITNTPGYQFVRDQGIKALDASAASKGMLRSGNQERAVQDYGTNLANGYYQQYIDNLLKQQALGAGAIGSTGNANSNAAAAYAAMKGSKASNYNNLIAALFA